MMDEADELEPVAAARSPKRSRMSAAFISLLAMFGIIPRWVLTNEADPRRLPR